MSSQSCSQYTQTEQLTTITQRNGWGPSVCNKSTQTDSDEHDQVPQKVPQLAISHCKPTHSQQNQHCKLDHRAKKQSIPTVVGPKLYGFSLSPQIPIPSPVYMLEVLNYSLDRSKPSIETTVLNPIYDKNVNLPPALINLPCNELALDTLSQSVCSSLPYETSHSVLTIIGSKSGILALVVAWAAASNSNPGKITISNILIISTFIEQMMTTVKKTHTDFQLKRTLSWQLNVEYNNHISYQVQDLWRFSYASSYYLKATPEAPPKQMIFDSITQSPTPLDSTILNFTALFSHINSFEKTLPPPLNPLNNFIFSISHSCESINSEESSAHPAPLDDGCIESELSLELVDDVFESISEDEVDGLSSLFGSISTSELADEAHYLPTLESCGDDKCIWENFSDILSHDKENGVHQSEIGQPCSLRAPSSPHYNTYPRTSCEQNSIIRGHGALIISLSDIVLNDQYDNCSDIGLNLQRKHLDSGFSEDLSLEAVSNYTNNNLLDNDIPIPSFTERSLPELFTSKYQTTDYKIQTENENKSRHKYQNMKHHVLTETETENAPKKNIFSGDSESFLSSKLAPVQMVIGRPIENRVVGVLVGVIIVLLYIQLLTVLGQLNIVQVNPPPFKPI